MIDAIRYWLFERFVLLALRVHPARYLTIVVRVETRRLTKEELRAIGRRLR